MSKKIYATILLDEKDHYVYDDGNLPIRPDFDKELLKDIYKNETVTEKGYNMLPPSIQKIVDITQDEPTAPVTVPEINALADILLVIRGKHRCRSGKVFRFDNFTPILKEGNIEIFRRR